MTELAKDLRFDATTANFLFCIVLIDFLFCTSAAPRDFLIGTVDFIGTGDFLFSLLALEDLVGAFTPIVFGVILIFGDFMAEKLVSMFAVEVTLGTNGIPVCGTGVLKSEVLDLVSLF